jgi:hypothetical protein
MTPLWTVYNRPPDYPNHVVVCECVVGERGRVRFVGECRVFASLEDAHEWLLTHGMSVRLPRQPGDDPSIAENWL